MTDPLDDLIAKAASKRAAAAGARSAWLDQESRDGRRATSALGRFAAKGWWFPVASVAGVTAMMGVYGLSRPTVRYVGGGTAWANPAIEIAIGGAIVVALMIAVIVAARASVRAAIAREEAWLAALPFALVDHFRLLGRLSGSFSIDFAGEAPPRALLRELVSGAAVPPTELEADFDGGRACVDVDWNRNPADGGHPRWRAWRAIVGDLLVPLHARFPIRAVTIR